jgi:hypothetical protein
VTSGRPRVQSLRRSRRPDKAHDYPRMAGARREGRAFLRRGPGRVLPIVALDARRYGNSFDHQAAAQTRRRRVDPDHASRGEGCRDTTVCAVTANRQLTRRQPQQLGREVSDGKGNSPPHARSVPHWAVVPLGSRRLERWDWCRRCASTERVTHLDLGQDWTFPLSFLVARGVHPYASGDGSETIAAALVQRLTDQAIHQA